MAAPAGHGSTGNGAVRHRANAAKRSDSEAAARKQAGYSQALADDLPSHPHRRSCGRNWPSTRT